MGDKEETVSSGFSRMKEEGVEPNSRPCLFWTFQRQILVVCIALVTLALCGILGGVIALRVHLWYTSADLIRTEERLSAYETIIKNLTDVLSENGLKIDDGGILGGTTVPTSDLNDPSVVYFRWGASTCPDAARLVYQGITASASNSLIGGGSNHLCMTRQPDFISPMAGKQDGRSHIYRSEYRTNIQFTPLDHLHGHDAPCAVCLAFHRSNVLMVPGATTCPETGNWTREYFGYLMAARNNFKRTSYICVDSNAETIPGSSAATQHGDILFPVEAFCNTNAEGGLACAPYVDGNEVTCAVCTI